MRQANALISAMGRLRLPLKDFDHLAKESGISYKRLGKKWSYSDRSFEPYISA